MRLSHLAVVLALPAFLLACPNKDKGQSPAASGSTSVSSATPAVASSTPAASASTAAPATSIGGTPLAADTTGALAVAWKVANAPNERVTVSVVAGGDNAETIAVGTLNAAADDAAGTIATCGMHNIGAASRLSCGGTPAYNFYTAEIKGGALVITLTTGVDQDPGSEKVTTVLKRPTTATSLKATGPATPALFGNCRPGFVQRGPDSPCLRQCLKGTECKGKDKCDFITAKGTDGDHKVHACIPSK